MNSMGNGWKKLYLSINDGAHAELRLKLRYDNIPQRVFFKMLVEAYITDNPLMRETIKDINTKRLSRRSLTKMRKDEKNIKKETKAFGLSEEEIMDIYDQIEGEE